MKINKYSIMKNMALVFIMIIVVPTFLACSKDKSIVLNNDVKTNSKSQQDSIKVNQSFININSNKGEMFIPCFWKDNKLLGVLETPKRIDIDMPYSDKFYSININENSLDKTNQESYSCAVDSIKGPALDEKEKLYYYDFTEDKSKRFYIKGYNEGLDENYKATNGNMYNVDGNNRFLTYHTYRINYRTNKQIGTISLFDLKTNKLYKNNNIGDINISIVGYCKFLKKFIVFDNKGEIFKVNFNGQNLEIEKICKIDISDFRSNNMDISDFQLNNMDINAKIQNDNIYIINFDGNKLLKYNIKTKESKVLLDKRKEGIKMLDYFPKQNVLVLEKENEVKDNNIKTKMYSDIYLAEIKNDELNIFYRNSYKNIAEKYKKEMYEKLLNSNKKEDLIKMNHAFITNINDKGDKLSIIVNIEVGNKKNKNILERSQVVDYYNIKRN
ncbi:hypothetical protein [Clostridium oceanicum]|uniref:Lipoprotein n=1 Tax=Clostridium oceanicum TaxID=1543 RepID=A0ABP3UKT9_9CLOT